MLLEPITCLVRCMDVAPLRSLDREAKLLELGSGKRMVDVRELHWLHYTEPVVLSTRRATFHKRADRRRV